MNLRTESDIARVDGVSEELGGIGSLSNAYDAIVNVVLNSLGSTVVFMRTKSLRALGQIVVADSDVLRKVRRYPTSAIKVTFLTVSSMSKGERSTGD